MFDVGSVLLDLDPRHLSRASPSLTPQIHEVLLGRFDLDPETTLFIDDWEVNVAAAAHLGMEAYLYTGPEPVLARLGLVRG